MYILLQVSIDPEIGFLAYTCFILAVGFAFKGWAKHYKAFMDEEDSFVTEGEILYFVYVSISSVTDPVFTGYTVNANGTKVRVRMKYEGRLFEVTTRYPDMRYDTKDIGKKVRIRYKEKPELMIMIDEDDPVTGQTGVEFYNNTVKKKLLRDWGVAGIFFLISLALCIIILVV